MAGPACGPTISRTAALETWIGRVDGLEDEPVIGRLAEFDCRNNRLAQLGLRQDGFEGAVAGARSRYGPHRIAVLIGTSTSGMHETELAYRQRDGATGALPAGFRYRHSQNVFSVADFVRRYLRLAGPGGGDLHGVLVERQGFRQRPSSDRSGFCRRRGGRRRGQSVPHDALRVRLAGAAVARAVPAVRRGARRHLDRRGGRLRAARARGRAAGRVALLGLRGKLGRLSHVGASPGGRRRAPGDERGARARGPRAGARSTTSTCTAPATPANDRAEDAAIASHIRRCDSRAARPRAGPGIRWAPPAITEAIISALCLEHSWVPGSLNTRTLDPVAQEPYRARRGAAPVAARAVQFVRLRRQQLQPRARDAAR